MGLRTGRHTPYFSEETLTLQEIVFIQNLAFEAGYDSTVIPVVSSGSGAPVTTPGALGEIYIDTTGDDVYIAVGTASAADWVNVSAGGGSGTPGGSDTQVQFNDGGSFGGITGATTDGTVLTLTNGVLAGVTVIDGGVGQDYLVQSNGNNGLHIQGQSAATLSEIDLSSNDADGTDNVNVKVFGVGDSGDANNERLSMGYNASNTDYRIHTMAQGTGTVRPLRLYTGTNTAQLVLNTDASVSINAGSDTAELNIGNFGTFRSYVNGDTEDAIAIETALSIDLILGSGGYFNIFESTGANAVAFFDEDGNLDLDGGISMDGSVTVGISVLPDANDGAVLGSSTLGWSDLFLATGAVINFNNGDVTVTHAANTLTFAGATTNGYQFADGPIRPTANDGIALGASSFGFSDVYLASGAFVYWQDSAGTRQYEITHTGTPLRLTRISDNNIGNEIYIVAETQTPANNDIVSRIFFRHGTAASPVTYAQIVVTATDVTTTSEDGVLSFAVMTAGTLSNELQLTGAALYPTTNDGLTLGTSSLGYADLFLAEGAVINFDNGDLTLTQTGNRLTIAGGNLDLETGGNILVNNANPFKSMILTASGGQPTTTSGCAAPTKVEAGTNDVDYFVLDFDAATKENAFWNAALPDNYDGSTVTARFKWTSAAGSAGNVIWGIEMLARGDDDAIDTAYGTAQTVTDAWIANGDVHITANTSAITIGGTPAAGDQLFIRVYRDAANGSDTLAGDARLLQVVIEYGVNAFSE